MGSIRGETYVLRQLAKRQRIYDPRSPRRADRDAGYAATRSAQTWGPERRVLQGKWLVLPVSEGVIYAAPITLQTKPSFRLIHSIGQWKADVPIPQNTSLEESEERLEEGQNKDAFLKFMRSMLRWQPEDRKTASELLKDPWLNRKLD